MFFEPGMWLSVAPGMAVRSWEGSYLYLIRGREDSRGNPPPPTQLCRRDEALPRTIQFSPSLCVGDRKLLVFFQINSFPFNFHTTYIYQHTKGIDTHGRAPAHAQTGGLPFKATSQASFLYWCFMYQSCMQDYFAAFSLFSIFLVAHNPKERKWTSFTLLRI